MWVYTGLFAVASVCEAWRLKAKKKLTCTNELTQPIREDVYIFRISLMLGFPEQLGGVINTHDHYYY